ncbi:MAG: HNH endonuclease [Methanomicrobia archaeon]|nr:HNH endonuclease [Methanomicrobia archaeon]
MGKRRKKIPRDKEAQILFINDKTCCICRDSTKGVQIHHIDGDPNNNDLSNLAVVCINHHDELHKSGGMTKSISPDLLKKYKYEWELEVKKRRQYESPKSLFGIEEILFEYEIRKTIYEITALKDSDVEGIEQRLDFLWYIYISEEEYQERILHDLSQITFLGILKYENKFCLIVDNMKRFFYHLGGPEHIRITESDIKNLEIVIKMIGTIGYFRASFEKSSKIMTSVFRAFSDIWETLILYDLESHALKVLDEIDKISETIHKSKGSWSLNIDKILFSLRKLLKTTTIEKQSEWKKVLERLNK